MTVNTVLHIRRSLMISSTDARVDLVGRARVALRPLAVDSTSRHPGAHHATFRAGPGAFCARTGPPEVPEVRDRTPRVCSSCSGYRHNPAEAAISVWSTGETPPNRSAKQATSEAQSGGARADLSDYNPRQTLGTHRAERHGPATTGVHRRFREAMRRPRGGQPVPYRS